MFNLSDDELSQLMTAAVPLDPDRRDAFVRAVAAEVASCSVRGPGTTHQVIAKIQRQFWQFHAQRQPASVAHNRSETPLFAASIERAALKN
jgi:hypothetical protein